MGGVDALAAELADVPAAEVTDEGVDEDSTVFCWLFTGDAVRAAADSDPVGALSTNGGLAEAPLPSPIRIAAAMMPVRTANRAAVGRPARRFLRGRRIAITSSALDVTAPGRPRLSDVALPVLRPPPVDEGAAPPAVGLGSRERPRTFLRAAGAGAE